MNIKDRNIKDRNIKERQKQYYQKNKERIKIYSYNYYIENIEYIRERQNSRYTFRKLLLLDKHYDIKKEDWDTPLFRKIIKLQEQRLK